VKVPWPVEPAKIEEKNTRGGGGSSNPPKKVGERVSSHSFLEGKKRGEKIFLSFSGK
jgi:hypothetical protein